MENIEELKRRLHYKWLRFKVFYIYNIGIDEFNGIQFLELHIVPKKNVKTDYVLNQYYNTHEIWSIGSYFVFFDRRGSAL